MKPMLRSAAAIAISFAPLGILLAFYPAAPDSPPDSRIVLFVFAAWMRIAAFVAGYGFMPAVAATAAAAPLAAVALGYACALPPVDILLRIASSFCAGTACLAVEDLLFARGREEGAGGGFGRAFAGAAAAGTAAAALGSLPPAPSAAAATVFLAATLHMRHRARRSESE